ncbi:MAG TPA: hypothetical protein EYP23_03215 [Thermoplasmata archaeon]|nr:hypothetical protein [Thermoplasmata archaeon]
MQGVLQGKKATIYPGMENEIKDAGGEVENKLVVQDDNIVTSRGSANAILSALKLASLLVNEEAAIRVGRRMLVDLVTSVEQLTL